MVTRIARRQVRASPEKIQFRCPRLHAVSALLSDKQALRLIQLQARVANQGRKERCDDDCRSAVREVEREPTSGSAATVSDLRTLSEPRANVWTVRQRQTLSRASRHSRHLSGALGQRRQLPRASRQGGHRARPPPLPEADQHRLLSILNLFAGPFTSPRTAQNGNSVRPGPIGWSVR